MRYKITFIVSLLSFLAIPVTLADSPIIYIVSQLPSPDEKMVAMLMTYEGTGQSPRTNIRLRANGDCTFTPVRLMGPAAKISLKWLSNDHLEVSYASGIRIIDATTNVIGDCLPHSVSIQLVPGQ